MCFLHNLFPGKNETSGDYCPCGLLRCQCLFFSPPPPPPPPPPASGSSVSATVIIIIVILCISFIFVAYYAIIVKCCSCWRSSRASPAEEEPEDDDDSDDGMQPANFIWYVNTVGLDESVIKSISMCKYKRGDGLVEGTECSVCLTEFRDGEYLRLLPKCSHTFHVNCIDTWLKSHVNCPVCRASVVSNPPTASSSTVGPSGSSLLPNSQNGIELQSESDGRSTLVPDAGISEDELRRNTLDVETLKRVSSLRAYYELRVLSDLAENRRLGESSVDITGGDEAQQVRRSASMDSTSLSSLLPKNQEMDRRTSMGESSGTKRTDQSPMYGYDRRLIKLTSKSTFGPPLFGAPVALKRSFSSGGRFFLSRYSKGQNSSVIPL